MPIIKCPECNKDISNQAVSCPHCGYRLKETPQSMSGCGWFLLIVGAIITAVILLSIGL